MLAPEIRGVEMLRVGWGLKALEGSEANILRVHLCRSGKRCSDLTIAKVPPSPDPNLR